MNPSIEGLYFVEKTRIAVPAGVILPSAFLRFFHPISEKAARFIDSKAFQCSIPKNKFLLRSGQVCPYLFLVSKGLFRGYIVDGKNEATTWITAENDLVASISSFFDHSPSVENIQALEDLDLIGIHFDDLEVAYQKFPELNTAARKVLQQLYRQAEERAYLVRLAKASSRYTYFQEHQPELVNRVSLKFIASHLGMTLETLSRLRGSILRPSTDNSEKSI